jgi:uncharacterized zinc-type alcohol dehydrogenase-like protein
MSTVKAYGAPAANAPLEPLTIERRDLDAHDVLIDIKFAGICHSDIHTVRGDWGPMPYPVVPGHEIAGIVAAVGSAVTKHQVGDRVGVGCMVSSCGTCTSCEAGQENYCLNHNTPTYAGTDKYGATTQGGYSTAIVVEEDFVLRIPEGIGLDVAAPLLCAGVTTYSPLQHWGAGPGKKVAVIGLGGLGHMAVKIASAMGAEVTVLSQSLKKREDGLQLGASDYRATDDPSTFEALKGTFDLIINTVSAALSMDKFVNLLALDGTIVVVGAPPKPIVANMYPLAGMRRSIAGSMIGGIAETQDMLDFCAAHGLGAEIEVISADQVNEAYERVLASDVRYRFVIDTSTI